MNIVSLRFASTSSGLSKTHFSRNLRRTVKYVSLDCVARRRYATHRDAPGSDTGGPTLRLSQTLDQRQRPSAPDHVGPFNLGMSPSYAQKNAPKWKELNTKGKLLRSTANTSNLVVILVGAGLCCVLLYSLTSELFSPNSPTVLYGDACDRVKASARVKKYLNGNISFHTDPPSSLRPRHRNRQVASQVIFDSAGREHMLLSFYISAIPISATEDGSFLDKLELRWNRLMEMSSQDYAAWIRTQSQKTWENAKSVVKFVSGAPEKSGDTGPQVGSSVVDPTSDVVQSDPSKESSWFSGLFGSLKAATGGGGNLHVTNPEIDGRLFSEGEVHVDFVRDPTGYFAYRYLVVDLPNSQSRNHVRIYVERAPGVNDREVYTRS